MWRRSIYGFSTPPPPLAWETSPASFPAISNAGHFQVLPPGRFRAGIAALKSGRDPAEITFMFFGITNMYFPVARRGGVVPGAASAWDGVATPGEVGRPGDLPVPLGPQLRRWGAPRAVARLALPGGGGARAG